MSKAEELVKVCELLTHWGCEESVARQAAIQIVSGHPCDIDAVFLSDNLVMTSFVGEDAPELMPTHASLTSQARSYPKYIVSVYEVTGCGMPPFELFRFGNGQIFDVTHSESKKIVKSLTDAIFTLEAMKKNIPSKEDEMGVLRLKTLQYQGDQEI